MNILDTSFEENSFIINGYTLEYKTDENGTPEWKYATHTKTGKPNYPYYVGVKNKTGVHVPTNSVKGISPFEMSNPKLSDLFGLHVYNKPFGFQEMQIIPSVNNYPYYGNDGNKLGLYYSYDGLVTGYVLNGVSEEDIKLTNGNKELKVHTINEDDITNSETKRVIYTPKDNNDVLPYGPYYKVETYFYSVNGRTEYSPSGKSTFYYKYTENDEEKYIQIQPQDVKKDEHNNEYYTYSNGNYHDLYENVGGIQIYDENGMVYYIKQGNSYVRNDSISSYQYAVISNDNNTLHLTDGYGEDVEINLNEGYDRLYPTDIIITDKLKINKAQVDYYDEFYLFKNPTPTLVPVVEDVYKIINTSNTISDLINEITVTSDEVNYKINIVVHKAVFNTTVENIGTKTIFREYTYKLDDNTFKVIDRELNGNGYKLTISCNNDLSYDKSQDNNSETIFQKFLDVIIGEDISEENRDYKINEVDGGIEVSIVINDTNSNNNIILNGNVNLGNITNISGKMLAPEYVYNRVDKIVYEKERIEQEKEVFILEKEDIDNNPEVYITLDIGTIVCIGTLQESDEIDNENKYLIVIDYNEKEIEINGLTYTYKIKKITDSNGNDIEYYYNSNEINYFPETPQLLLNIFYGDYVGYDNDISENNDVDDNDLYYIYNDIDGDDSNDYVFMLCKKNIDNVIYYSYSPKICVNKPEYKINFTDKNNTKIQSVTIYVSNNEYLKNYNCKIDRVQKYGVSEETILESWEINPTDITEDGTIELTYNQNIIVNPIENEKINIYDCTGLKLEELNCIPYETDESCIYVDVTKKIVFKTNSNNYDKMEIVLNTTDENNNNKILVDLTDEDKTNGYILMNSDYSDINNIKEISLINGNEITFGPKSVSEIRHQIVTLKNNNLGIVIYTNDVNFNYSYIEGNTLRVSIDYTTWCNGSNKIYNLVNKKLEFKNLQEIDIINNSKGYLFDLGIKYDKYEELDSDKSFWCNGVYYVNTYRVTNLWLEINNPDLSGCIYKNYIIKDRYLYETKEN